MTRVGCAIGQPRRMETCGAEEPYEGNLHGRFGGGIGRVIAEPTRTRAKASPKPGEEEPSSEMGCGDPGGASPRAHVPPDARLASRAGAPSTGTPRHGRTTRAGTRTPAAG